MSASPQPATSSAPASSGSPLRLIILIVLLAGVIGLFVYDRQVAEPKSEAAYQALEEFVAAENAKGVNESKMVRSEDVQKALGMAPTFVDTKEKYTVEYYCWFGKIPVLNTWKRYLTVVYVSEPRRYDAHYKNQRPPVDSLPDYVPPAPPEGTVEEADLSAEGAGGPPPEGDEGGGKKKGGKKKGGEAPAEETPAPGDAPSGDAPPATDTPATETPATETPAATPAEPASTEPPADEKPAAEKPAEPSSPAEDKPAGEDAGKADEPE